MTVLATSMRSAARISLFAVALAIAVLALARDSRPASAADTEIIISLSNSVPAASDSLILLPGDPSVQLYIWARGVTDPEGLGGYGIKLNYVSWLVNVTNFTFPGVSWLFSTGRSGSCLPIPPTNDPHLDTGQGYAEFGCYTIGPPPPAGPQGDGVIGSFRLAPGQVLGSTTLDFTHSGPSGTGSFLQNTGTASNPPIPPADIPTTVHSVVVTIAPCADLNGAGGLPDGTVSITDILFEASKFGMNSASPGWNPAWDMDGNAYINIPDILIVARQFGRHC